MKLLSVVFLFLCLCFLPFTTFAEVKIFVHTVRQPFSGSQSPDDARVAATHKAKREVLEKAGTYLESIKIVEKGRLTKDQILALASGVLKTEIISQKNYMTGEGFGIVIKARVKVDTNVLEERVKKRMADRTAMEQLTAVRKREKELLAKVERLEEVNRRLAKKKETQAVKKQKRELKKDFQQTTKGFDAVALNDRTADLWKDEEYSDPKKAIELLNKAIQLDPGYARSYGNRGNAYANLKQYDRAFQDYDRAIELDPGFVWAYVSRGVAYIKLNQPIRAIQDMNRVIELEPGEARSYFARSVAYIKLKQYARAIQDYDKAIGLAPGDAMAYLMRGVAYFRLNQPIRAIQDYDKAIGLAPGFSESYRYRGTAYFRLRQPTKALQDFDKAIELDPGNANYYNYRGVMYMAIQKISRGCADLKKACELGNCYGLESYIKKGECL